MSHPEGPPLQSSFDIGHLGFVVVNPTTADTGSLMQLYDAALWSYGSGLPGRNQQDVVDLLGGGFEGFAATRRNPQLVQGHPAYNPNLEFFNPRLVVAEDTTQNNKVVAYGYASDNVSGSESARRLKRHSGLHTHVFMREVAIVPDLPELDIKGAPRGADLAIVRLLMDGFSDIQPVSYFSWPEAPREAPLAEAIGLERNGRAEPVRAFGPARSAVLQQAWKGRVYKVKEVIDSKPGGGQALAHIQQNTRSM